MLYWYKSTNTDAGASSSSMQSQNPAMRGEPDDDSVSLLLLLGRAVLNEVLLPVISAPKLLVSEGTTTITRTLKRVNDTVTMQRRTRDNLMLTSTDSLAHHFYDKMNSQPIRFLPTRLPPALIDRSASLITRAQLDANIDFKYMECVGVCVCVCVCV